MSPALDVRTTQQINGAANGYQNLNGASITTNGHSAKSPAFLDGFGTRAIHVGSEVDSTTGAVIPPISLSTTFAQSAPGFHKGFEYSRSDNPNRSALERLLASIEIGGSQAVAFSSGSAATATVVQSLGRDIHILSVNDVYGGTYRYLKRVASEMQALDVTFLDLEHVDEETIRENIRENTKLIWLESPTNPTLKLMNISRIASIAHSHPSAPLLLVDNTFLSPFYSSPLLLGADIVVHSLTKYINGHSDVVMGAAILPNPSSPHPLARHTHPDPSKLQKFAERLRFMQNATGAVPSAYDSWLAQRGAKTLHLRMKQHGLNALKVAKALRSHPLVEEVLYPGLEGDKRYELAWKTLSAHAKRWIEEEVILSSASASASVSVSAASSTTSLSSPPPPSSAPSGGFPFSGMISFRLPSHSHALAFLTSTRLFTLAESLGGVESLAEHPASMTHGSIPKEERIKVGIDDGLIRLSVGVEEGEDLVRDVLAALDRASEEVN